MWEAQLQGATGEQYRSARSRPRAAAEEVLPKEEAEGSLHAAAPHSDSRLVAVLKVHVHSGPAVGGHVAFHQGLSATATATVTVTAAAAAPAPARGMGGVIVGAVLVRFGGYTTPVDLEQEALSCSVVLRRNRAERSSSR